jgi:RNA polymerase sigma-70 factor (ECF subfamily)
MSWTNESRGRGPSTGAGIELSQLKDPDSELAQQWDREHDRYVLRCLLDVVEREFEPRTIRAFRRVTLDDAAGSTVANELGLSVGAVYAAKFRVLQRIREEAEGLID